MLTTSKGIALALERAGAEVTCIPSFGANAVFNDYCSLKNQRQSVSLHPEAAFGIAWGASLLGKRAATLLKAHGFLKAGNQTIAPGTLDMILEVYKPYVRRLTQPPRPESSHADTARSQPD